MLDGKLTVIDGAIYNEDRDQIGYISDEFIHFDKAALCAAIGTGSSEGGTARTTSYSNLESGLVATNVQDAIDEVHEEVEDALLAAGTSYDGTMSGLLASNVQDAIDEVNTLISDMIVAKSVSMHIDNIDIDSFQIVEFVPPTVQGYTAYSWDFVSGTAAFVGSVTHDSNSGKWYATIINVAPGARSGDISIVISYRRVS